MDVGLAILMAGHTTLHDVHTAFMGRIAGFRRNALASRDMAQMSCTAKSMPSGCKSMTDRQTIDRIYREQRRDRLAKVLGTSLTIGAWMLLCGLILREMWR